ncbi:MAG: glycine zipper 2TM domain-containing protein [Chromatiales bacterium]|nr:glycine zipper 2TM domain-containing protein [Chromatiales bacterium]
MSVTVASAGHRFDRGDRNNDGYALARVTEVEPIIDRVQVSEPFEVCRDEYVRGRRHDAALPTLFGGLLGGVIGNQFGHGRGRHAATAAGVLIGATVGHEASAHSHRGGRYVTSCDTEYRYHTEERVAGYRVHYRYDGRNYVTRTDEDPGKYIRVRVDVSPVEGRRDW